MNKSCFNLGSNGPLKRLFDGTRGERGRERERRKRERRAGGRESEKVRKRERKRFFFSADKLCQ